MTLRLAAALALLLGVAALLGFLHLLGVGPFVTAEARHMRAMKDRRAPPAEAMPIGFAEIDSLPSRHPLAEYAPLERRGAVLEGYVKHMLRAPDGDTHLEVVARLPVSGTDDFYVTAEITPQWYRSTPRWSFESLMQTFRPASGGSVTRWGAVPRRVRLTGWLLYDFQFDPLLPGRRRLAHTRRLSAWELHPVTRIEVWDEARGAFAEVPR